MPRVWSKLHDRAGTYAGPTAHKQTSCWKQNRATKWTYTRSPSTNEDSEYSHFPTAGNGRFHPRHFRDRVRFEANPCAASHPKHKCNVSPKVTSRTQTILET